ncbi:hypothetical protein BDZ89DRAFT_1224258 [Hymenopellis radicata]|nr:hypothetical protein BDZ89DRAFT_1224258 [Hymenopellis radicata]
MHARGNSWKNVLTAKLWLDPNGFDSQGDMSLHQLPATMRISRRAVTADAVRCHQHFEPSPADLPQLWCTGVVAATSTSNLVAVAFAIVVLALLIIATLPITPDIFRSTFMAQRVCLSMSNTISPVAWLLPITLIDYQLRRHSHRRDWNFLTRSDPDDKKTRGWYGHGHDASAFSPHPTSILSGYLQDVGSAVHIHILPGKDDPCGAILPQQLFPHVLVSSLPSFPSKTNPTYLRLGGAEERTPISHTISPLLFYPGLS